LDATQSKLFELPLQAYLEAAITNYVLEYIAHSRTFIGTSLRMPLTDAILATTKNVTNSNAKLLMAKPITYPIIVGVSF